MLFKDREDLLIRYWRISGKLSLTSLSSIGFGLATASILSIPTSVQAQADIEEILDYSDRHLNEKITQVLHLKDISSSNWSYEDETFQGDGNITRYEFAAGLNSCLKKIEDLVYDKYGQPKDTIIRENNTESNLANVSGEIDKVDSRTAILKYNQFSTTTKLFGEAIFGFGSILSGTKDNGETEIDRIPFFGDRINLELATSFTGEDRLSIKLEAANLPVLADVTDTFQGKLAFSGTNDNSLELDLLAYTFLVGEKFEIIIGATGLAADDIAETINFLEGDDGADGAISNFAALNPIYETAEDAGIGIVYELNDIELSAGYLAAAANESTDGGIFNAPYGAIAQAIISPSDRLNLAFTYVHSRDLSDTDTGSDLANLRSFTEDEFDREVPTVSDSYGAEFTYELSDAVVLGGWGGLSKVTTLSTLSSEIDRGTQSIWNWAVSLSFPDLGKEGNLGGIVIGAEPWVTSSSIDRLGEDENMSLHLEAFYQYRLSDNLAITPGIIWITAPDNSDREDDLVVGAIRTTFAF